MRLQTFSTQPEFITASIEHVIKACQKNGAVYVALSGGKTPQPIYEALATNPTIEFKRIEWYLVDERCVPLDHPDSNYRMIMESFDSAQPEFSKHFHYFNTSLVPNETARQYAEELQKIPEQKFDLLMLGIGNDGHTASLFPHSPTLKENKRLAIDTVNKTAPKNPPVRNRLTITWPMIMKSKAVLLLASGKEKEAVVNELDKGTESFADFPAKKLLEHPRFQVNFLI